MPIYKDCNGVKFEMTEAEIAEHDSFTALNEQGLVKREAIKIRVKRNALLIASDWSQFADSTLDEAAQVLWRAYRQALRDVPQQSGFPNTIEWPVAPE